MDYKARVIQVKSRKHTRPPLMKESKGKERNSSKEKNITMCCMKTLAQYSKKELNNI